MSKTNQLQMAKMVTTIGDIYSHEKIEELFKRFLIHTETSVLSEFKVGLNKVEKLVIAELSRRDVLI